MSHSQNRELLHILSGSPDGQWPSDKMIGSIADDTNIDALTRAALRFHATDHEREALPDNAIPQPITQPTM